MTQPEQRSRWSDAVRLSLGTLTAIPVGAPRQVDRVVAGRAMLLAPAVGGALGGLAALVVWGAGRIYHQPLLAAALAVATLAILTRGLHLDGLADTADGLGVGAHRGRERALAVMRSGDVGPFGVTTIVLVLLIQVTALADSSAEGIGVDTVIAATVIARLCAMIACIQGIPGARPDGLGASVSGSVQTVSAGVMTLAVTAAVVTLGAQQDVRAAVTFGLSTGASLAITFALIALARKRFGGITGDVLGAIVEIAFVTALLVLATYHR